MASESLMEKRETPGRGGLVRQGGGGHRKCCVVGAPRPMPTGLACRESITVLRSGGKQVFIARPEQEAGQVPLSSRALGGAGGEGS